MSTIVDGDGHRVKRFKHQSYNEQLKTVHAPLTLSRTGTDIALENEPCVFNAALAHWMQLNLSPKFIAFSQKVSPISLSLPLLLHSWREVLDLWLDFVQACDDEALKPMFDLLQKLVEDLRLTLMPAYDEITSCLFGFLPRRLSPDAFTALLTALNSVFKQLLVPVLKDASNDVLEVTWTSITSPLLRCNPEISRAVSEVWASVLRRVTERSRRKCVQVMISTLEGNEDFVAWSLVFASKSIAQTLHTCASGIVTTCVEDYLQTSVESENTSAKLNRRLLTALIHHCAKPEQFTVVGDVLIEKAESLKDDTTSPKKLLELLSVICSVRGGSRMTSKQLSRILDLMIQVKDVESLRNEFVSLASTAMCSTSSALSVLMGPGRRAIEYAWSIDDLMAVNLTGTLYELGWTAFSQFALPPFLSASSRILSQTQSDNTLKIQVLRILSRIAADELLKSKDPAFSRALTGFVMHTLRTFTPSAERIILLSEIPSLVHLTDQKKIAPHLLDLVRRLLKSEVDLKASFHDVWWNEAYALRDVLEIYGSLMTSLNLTVCNDDSREVILHVIQRLWWSGSVMQSLLNLAKLSQMNDMPHEEHTDEAIVLRHNLLSYSGVLRCCSLELLSMPLFNKEITKNALEACLEAERIPLNVQCVRERILATSKVGSGAAIDGNEGKRFRITWLLGQLKVGLRPVWAVAIDAIALISQHDGDTVWDIVFDQLSNLHAIAKDVVSPVWNTDEEDLRDEVNESERMWRDPSAHKARVATSTWTTYKCCINRIIESQNCTERFDPISYEAQLIEALVKMPSIAEKHSRDLVPQLLSIADRDHLDKATRVKLKLWLKLFSNFSNPKAFYRSDDVRELYQSILSHPDRELQTLALSCLHTFKNPILSRQSDSLNLLLDETRWRDEVTNLNIQAFTLQERETIIPVLIRMFYGMIRERRGQGKGVSRRSALLGVLGSCTENELKLLVDLMTEGFCGLDTLDLEDTWVTRNKQQIGFLSFLEAVLKILGTKLGNSIQRLFKLTMMLVAAAQRDIGQALPEGIDEEPEELSDLDKDDDTTGPSVSLRQSRLVRQLGVKRLAQIFRLPIDLSLSSHLPLLYRTTITPRLDVFERENTQAPTPLFELFDAWSLRADTATYLVQYDNRTLAKIYDCLTAPNAKPVVLMRIFDMVERILDLSVDNESIGSSLVRPYMERLLSNLSECIRRATQSTILPSIDLLAQREIALLSKLSPHVSDPAQARTLLKLFLGQLRRRGKGVSEKAKTDMLVIVRNLFRKIPDLSCSSDGLRLEAFETLSALFQALRSRAARLALVGSFEELSDVVPTYATTSAEVAALNSYSAARLDQPDFDRRLAAFATINEKRWKSMTADDWKPVLFNALFFIQDYEELSIRSNASLSMKRFIERFSLDLDFEPFQLCFNKILFPGLKRALRSKYDPVHMEVLGVISHAVDRCGDNSSLSELRILLAGQDEEANFFNNVCHVQVHRRIRALHRLSGFCDEHGFRDLTYRELFIPIVSRFIADGVNHHLINEAIQALGKIAQHLGWSSYLALAQRYIRLTTSIEGLERIASRALVSILDNFHFNLSASIVSNSNEAERTGSDDEADQETQGIQSNAISGSTKVVDAVMDRLLPFLFSRLERRDELEDVNRIPLAAGMTRVCLQLPSDSRDIQLSRLLTIVAQVFRSKSQETRDVARDTLCRMVVTLGSSYLSLAVRQLREALQRGPHLHVLATVTHALLVHVTTGNRSANFTALDDCVVDAIHVAAEVVFGQSGRDVESEGFKTKSKEVRSSSSKGLDTFGILSQYITPTAMSSLLAPIKGILHETESSKILQSADEALRRIATGLNSNPHFGQTDVLQLSHTLITQNGQFFSKQERRSRKSRENTVSDVTVKLKRKQESEGNHFDHNSWRFVTFGLDLFTTMYRRGRLSLKDPDVLSRLEPFVGVIGNSLYSTNGSVAASGLKAAMQMVKCPLKSLDKSLPIFVRQAIEIVRRGGSTGSELSQAALKALTVIIRDSSAMQLKEKDLNFLLEVISPDLEEAERQPVAFPLLRAIVSRKFVVPEIYDLMDRVREIMITSQSPQVQEQCRSVYLQFLLEYPQGKGRLKQQFTFLAQNLSYIYESGRLSLIELLRAFISKVNDDIMQEYSDMLFVPLVLVIAQDYSPKCREMTGHLLRLLITRLDAEQRKAKMSYVHSWASASDKVALAKVSSQVYGFMMDCIKDDMKPFLPVALGDLKKKIVDAADEMDEGDVEELSLQDGAWQVPYHALTTLAKACQTYTEIVGDHTKLPWAQVSSLLLYPHSWVRAASCRLLGILYSSRPIATPENDTISEESDQSLALFSLKNVRAQADAFTMQLKSEHLDDALSLQVVKNLFYIGKCFYAAIANEDREDSTNLSLDGDEAEAEQSDEDDGEKGLTDALPWLFSRLSYQARSAHIARQKSPKLKNWTRQVEAIFKWFAAMASHMEGVHVERYLVHILSPVYRIMDETAIREPQLDELKVLATELQSLLQAKCGTTRFAEVYAQVRSGIIAVRDERRAARAVLSVKDPRASAVRKRKKQEKLKEVKKGRKKRKSLVSQM